MPSLLREEGRKEDETLAVPVGAQAILILAEGAATAALAQGAGCWESAASIAGVESAGIPVSFTC